LLLALLQAVGAEMNRAFLATDKSATTAATLILRSVESRRMTVKVE